MAYIPESSRAVVFACLLLACSNPAPVLEPLPSMETEELGSILAQQLAPLITRLRSDPANSQVAGKAGMLLQAYEQNQLAMRFFTHATALAPGEFRWEYYRGISLEALGRHEQAAASFRRCIELDADFLPVRRRLAETVFASGDLPASLAMYRELAEHGPDDARIQYGLGRSEAAADSTKQAIEHLLRATELAPEFGAAHYALARAYRDEGMLADANRHLDLFKRNEGGLPFDNDPFVTAVRALHLTAAELLARGVEAKEAGRVEQAIRLHIQALEQDPRLGQARTNLVILYGSLGRTEEAEEQYRMALSHDSATAELHYNFGVLAYRAGKPRIARQAFLEALELNPDHALANHNFGQMLEEEGRFDEAMARYRRALASRPDHALSHYKVGMLLARRRQAPEAVQAFRQAAKEQSDRTPMYLFSLGGALLTTGDRDRARDRFGEARSLAERYSQTELIGQIDAAMRALDRQPRAR